MRQATAFTVACIAAACASATQVRADVVTDWNTLTGERVMQARIGTPPAAFMQEVANARVWEGIHYRRSTEVGLAMGRQIGALAVVRVARAPLIVPVAQALD